MAIYRADQAQLTFGTEAAPGGMPELASSTTEGTGTALINNGDGYAAGSRQMTVDTNTSGNLVAGAFVRIGPEISADGGSARESEVRKIEFVDGTTLIFDAPTAFFHANNTELQLVTAVADTDVDKYIDLIPGVYETVDLPDPNMTIEPQYFLGTTSKRNFYSVYSGQQSFSGSIGNFVLLNGKALRFPIGQVASSTLYVNTAGTDGDPTYGAMIAGALKKGDVQVTVDAAYGTVAQNTYLVFTGSTTRTTESSTTSEVRKHIGSGSTTAIKLDYPLQFDHADDEYVFAVVTSDGGNTVATTQSIPYTHAITETVDLDSVTWHAHMRSSDEDSSKDFDRRYYGGKIGAASISAAEGGMVTMSWDSVNFLGMIHNQKRSSAFGSTDLPFYSLMKTIDSGDVKFPTTDPYYFSQGEVTMFGQTIARIRDFTLSVSNGEEPRYYISKQMGRHRGPTEIKEGRREYSMSATLALPDSTVAAETSSPARTLFSELLLEGDYGSGKAGFNVTITFTRGTNDSITITLPDETASTGGNSQGAFIRTAPHNFGSENPFQVDADIVFRNLKIDVQDTEHYYP